MREEVLKAGIAFKFHNEFEGHTWDSLNEYFNKPYANGESFRNAAKHYQSKLRKTNSKYVLPYASSDLDKILELKRERMKLSSLRVDLNRRIRENSRQELLIEEFIESCKRIKHYEPTFTKLQRQSSEKEYILAFADVHFGKLFVSLTNEYGIEIVEERFNKLYNEVIHYVDNFKIKTLHILNLGDSVEGMHLRVSQLQSLAIGLTDQVMKFSTLLINFLNKLSEKVKIEYHSVHSSNHTQIRPFGAKPNEFVQEDMERMILYHLKLAFKDNARVNVNTFEGKYPELQIFTYNVIMLHGHEHKRYNTLLKKISWKMRKFYDYAFVGHYHQSGIISSGEGENNNCEVIRVPSMMGCDEYADQLLLGSKAGATLLEFTSTQGKRKTIDIILN